MDARTWQQAKQWLLEAAALPESERSAFLAKRCPDDALRRELLEMLASDGALPDVLSASTLTSGTHLGPYEIDTVIGAGGMGEVYRARDRRLGRDVAIKVLPALFATDRDRLARFEREAKLLASLNHPHICTLFDVGRESGTDYIVMEHVDGELLSDRLRTGPLAVDRAVAYAIEIADALDKAHAVGIVHRDLKPGNVMLTKSGTKLLDFGLARSTRASSRDVTKTGTILGTLRYMSPEQLKGADADSRSDVWAFGCVLYQMLTGRSPFDSESEAAIGAAILEAQPPPLSAAARGVSPQLQRVVDRCLAKAPDDRWQSVADLRHELEWIAKPAERAADSATRVAPSRRERIAWGVAALAVVIAVAAASFAVWSSRRVPAPPFRRLSLPLPNELDQAGSFALSRDGLQLAFVGFPRDRTAQPLIWVRPLVGDADARPLIGTAGLRAFPFWAPDGRTLGFFAEGKLKTIDIATGAIRDLCPAPDGRGGTWAGHTILFVPAPGSGLYRVPDEGGQATPVTRPQTDELHRFPSFLADGVHFLFTIIKGEIVSIEVGSLGNAAITELTRNSSEGTVGRGVTQAYVAAGRLVFARDGSVLAQALDDKRWQLSGDPMLLAGNVAGDPAFSQAFAVSDSTFIYRSAERTPSQLTWISKSGEPQRTVWESAVFQSVQLSPDDTRAVVARSDGRKLFLWLIDLVRGNAPQQLTKGSGSPVLWSSKGDRVLFRKPEGIFHDHIYSVLVDGGGGERLEADQPEEGAAPLGWSDTGSLLYAAYAKSPADLWELPSSGKARVLIPAVKGSTDFSVAAVTRKGDLIASVVGKALYVQRIRGAGPGVLVDRGDLQSPRWSADGHELYYLSAGHLMAVDVSGVDHVNVGTPRVLFHLRGSWFSPSTDGRFLAAVPQPGPDTYPPGLVLNWTSPHDK